MTISRGASGIAMRFLSPLGGIVRRIKVQPPVKRFQFFPIIPPETELTNPQEIKTLISEINPDLVLGENVKQWRGHVIECFVKHLVLGCLRRRQINPGRMGILEFRKLRRRLIDLGIRTEKLDINWEERPRVIDIVPALTNAFVASNLGEKKLVVFVESRESAKIQVPILDETQDINFVNWKYLKLMSNLSDRFIKRYLDPYYNRLWKFANISQKIMLALLVLDIKGDELVNRCLSKFDIEGISLLKYLLITKPALAFLMGVNLIYLDDINTFWNSAYKSTLAVQKLGETLKYDLSDKAEIISGLRAFKRTEDMQYLRPIFMLLSQATKSEKPADKLKEIIGKLVSILQEYKEIKILPKALWRYYFSLSRVDKEVFIHALWRLAAGIPSESIEVDAVRQEKIMIVNLSPTINVKWEFDKEGEKCFAPELTPSGRGINVAVALRALGIDPVVLGVRGGKVGERYIELLKNIGLDAENFVETADDTRLFHILSSPEEIIIDDPPMQLTKEEFEELRTKIVEKATEGTIVVLSTGLPEGKFLRFNVEHSVKQLIDDLKAKGAIVYVDSRTDGLQAAYRAKADLIKCNRKEFAKFTGTKEKELDDLHILAREMKKIVSHGVTTVIVTLDKEGALLATEKGVLHAIPPEIKVENPVGSGDTLLGAYTKKISEGEDPREAFKFATAMATLSAAHPSTGLAMKIEREELLQRVQEIISQIKLEDVG